jgi:transcriptional regulator with XRE-family HTH domain
MSDTLRPPQAPESGDIPQNPSVALGVVGAAGVEIVPVQDGNVEAAADPEVAAITRLTELYRHAYDTMESEGHLQHLTPVKQRDVVERAGLQLEPEFVGAKINRLRDESGLKQREVAEGLYMSPSKLAKFFGGKSLPKSPRDVVAILREINRSAQQKNGQPIAAATVKQLIVQYMCERFERTYNKPPGESDMQEFTKWAEGEYEMNFVSSP